MLKRTYVTAIGGLLSLLLLASCGDNPSSFSDSPPELPPASSMQMDFSSFNFHQKAAAEQAPGVYNYSRAVGAAYILNQIVELNVTVPHALFSKAHEFDPTFTDEGKWEWKYSHSA